MDKRIKHETILNLLSYFRFSDEIKLILSSVDPKNIKDDRMIRNIELMEAYETLDTENSFLTVFAPHAYDISMHPFMFTVDSSAITDISIKEYRNEIKSFKISFLDVSYINIILKERIIICFPDKTIKRHYFH